MSRATGRRIAIDNLYSSFVVTSVVRMCVDHSSRNSPNSIVPDLLSSTVLISSINSLLFALSPIRPIASSSSSASMAPESSTSIISKASNRNAFSLSLTTGPRRTLKRPDDLLGWRALCGETSVSLRLSTFAM